MITEILILSLFFLFVINTPIAIAIGTASLAAIAVQGDFSLMDPEDSAAFAGVNAPSLPPVRVIESGAVRTIVEALLHWNHSAVCMRYILPAEGAEIGLDLRVFWNEKDSMLKLALPTVFWMVRQG